MDDQITEHTDESNHIAGPPTRRRRSKTLIIVLSVAAIPVVLFFVWRVRTQTRLSKMLADIRAEGYPVTCAELDEWYSIPEGAHNGADIVLEAFDNLQQWDKSGYDMDLPYVGEANRPDRNTPLDAETLERARSHLALNTDSLQLLHSLPECEHFRYPVDLSQGMAIDLDYAASVRKMAFLLCLEAATHTDAGDTDAALAALSSLFALSDSFDNEPILISQLVGIAVEALTISSLEAAIGRVDLNQEQLSRLIGILDKHQDSQGLARSLVGERCLFLDCVTSSTYMDGQGGAIPSPAGLKVYRAIGLAYRDAVRYVALVDQWIDCLDLPPQEQFAKSARIDSELQAIPKSYVFIHLLAPAFSRVLTLDSREKANLACAVTALRVLRARLDTGRTPASLTELVPDYMADVPVDPFDGKPLRYKQLDTGGFVVYSIGEDRTDNDGLERPPKPASDEPWDITFIVER